MAYPTLRHCGKAPNSGWDVYSLALADAGAFPDSFPVSSEKFVCLLSWNAANVSSHVIGAVAEKLLRAGCVYFCCWGQDCERVHDIVDEVEVGDGSSNVGWLGIMTTWHSKDTLAEAIDFFLDLACPSDIHLNKCSAAVAIVIGDELEAASMELTLALKLVQPPCDPPFHPARQARRAG